MGEETRPRGWRFTDGTTVFRLFPEQRRLFAGDKEVRIGQRAFDLLVFLVENPGRPLGKQEIMKGAWRGMTLADSSLSTHVWTLRKVIGTTPITVINSFGYQFTPDVEPAEDLPALPRPTRPLIDLPRRSAAGIGRESELAELAALAGNTEQHPILTIVGGGGIGKTWLAIELGWRLTEHFPDGIHVIDLAQARTPAAVASAAGRALDVPLRGGDAPAQILAAAIGHRRMLLIFDACEYAAGPAGEFIGALLVRAPKLSVLVTSQQQLRIPNETVFRLQPLPQDDAVKLFLQSAGAADRRFQTTPPNAASVADICRRLDGNPLMLEIAAALVPSLGVEAVRAGLDQQRFAMLDSRPRNAEPRQRTLSAIVEWSCGLLDAADRQVFRRLACFAGSFTADAAVAITTTNGATKWDILASLDRLVDKSLLVFDGGDPERYHLVETLALHAKAKLEASGETETIAERHARYYTELFLRADEAWETLLNDEWLIVYGPDIDNVRTALDWTLRDPHRLSIAIALAGAAGHLWERLAQPAEGRQYLDRFVVLINDDTSPADAARLLRRAGTLWRRVDRLRAAAVTERALALYRKLDDRLNLGSTLAFLGNDYVFLGRHAEAKSILDEARDILTGTSRSNSLWNVLNDLGSLALLTDDTDEARRCYVAATDLARSRKDLLRENISLNNLGEVEFRLGAFERAIQCAQAAATGFQALDLRSYFGNTSINLSSYLILQDKIAEARPHATEALSVVSEEGGHWLRLCLQVWALVAACEGRYSEAAQLIGFVDASYVGSGEIREPTERLIRGKLSALLAANLSSDDIRIWGEDGSRWSERAALEFAVAHLVPSHN